MSSREVSVPDAVDLSKQRKWSLTVYYYNLPKMQIFLSNSRFCSKRIKIKYENKLLAYLLSWAERKRGTPAYAFKEQMCVCSNCVCVCYVSMLKIELRPDRNVTQVVRSMIWVTRPTSCLHHERYSYLLHFNSASRSLAGKSVNWRKENLGLSSDTYM